MKAPERAREDLAERTWATVHAVAFDGTDESAVRRAIRETENGIGPLDILVDNTGVQHREPLPEVRAKTFERILHADLTSAFLTRGVSHRREAEKGSLDGWELVKRPFVARQGFASPACTGEPRSELRPTALSGFR